MATYGWAGKILRVDLTTGAVSTEDTAKYKDYIGGMGLGYKLIYDAVPLDTHPHEPEAPFVFGVGPLTGSGVPCSGRTNVSLLSSWTKGYSILDAHMGGHFAYALKYAGYDAVFVVGKSASPVYLKIDDDKVTLESAAKYWGKGTFETNKGLIDDNGPDFVATSIGPAGENLVNYSAIITSTGNAGGAGIGAAMGSKNLKALCVRGTGNVKVAEPAKLKELCDYMLTELIGGNNNHNVPTYPQSWAEYTAQPANRWRGGPGKKWELAPGGPIDTEEQPYDDNNRIAYRVMKGIQDFGEISTKYTVKYGGCSSCPVRCYAQYDMKPLGDFDLPTKVSNACVAMGANSSAWYAGEKGGPRDLVDEGDGRMLFGGAGCWIQDDLGLWENYSNLGRDFNYCYKQGVLKRVLSEEEWNSIPWNLMEEQDPRWMTEIMTRIANKEGEIAHLGDGSWLMAKRWGLGNEYYDNYYGQNITYNGFPKHHSAEDGWQSGALYNAMYNRDCMVHQLTNVVRSGSPFEVIQKVVDGFFGEGTVDKPKFYTPINPSKIAFAKWCFIGKQWHDSATLCNWMWDMTMSPSKARGYAGDLDLSAKFMSAVTGETWTRADVDHAAERISHMLRVMTAISFKVHEGSSNLRKDHDALTAWSYDKDPDFKAFEEGTDKLDREDMEKSFDMFYEAMGWDVATGIPTRATLEKFGLGYMADDLAKHDILPG